MTRSFFLRVLLAVIGFYRRRLSGRGPFAQMRCTFETQESCSIYAERIARESPSAWVALLRIRRRLRRCRHLSLYRLKGNKLGWGREYDGVLLANGRQALDEALTRDGEGEAVRAAVGRAAARIAGEASDPGLLPLLRDAKGVEKTWRRRVWGRLSAMLILGASAVGAELLGELAVASGLALATALSFAWVLAAARMLSRLYWLDVMVRIDGPRQSRQ